LELRVRTSISGRRLFASVTAGALAWAGLALTVPAAPARADMIFATTVVSIGSRQPLDGSQAALTTDLPNANWVWGAGWNWGAPFVSATWDPPGVAVNIASLGEEKTAVGLSLASAGPYTKPTQFTVSADLAVTGASGGGLGFWSAMPARDDSLVSTQNFTGLTQVSDPGNPDDGSLRLYENGTAVGAPVATGVTTGGSTFNTLQYDVDTATGTITNVLLNGNPVNIGAASAAFTDSATAFVGMMSGAGARTTFNSFSVNSITGAPEPASLSLLALGGLLVLPRRRRA
jgi:hypothetical protein